MKDKVYNISWFTFISFFLDNMTEYTSFPTYPTSIPLFKIRQGLSIIAELTYKESFTHEDIQKRDESPTEKIKSRSDLSYYDDINSEESSPSQSTDSKETETNYCDEITDIECLHLIEEHGWYILIYVILEFI